MERSARSEINTQIYQDACEWFIEFRGGEIDDAKRRKVDAWLRKSPEHLRAYLEIAAIWNEGPMLDPAGKWDMDTLVAQAAEGPDNIVNHPNHARAIESPIVSATPQVRRQRNPRWLLAIAASVVLVATGTWLYSQRNVYSTDIGEQRSIRLGDGSTVDLNSRSRIEVSYSRRQRTVDLLEGQALFQVAKDSSRPFVVTSDAARVRAVGTQFDVNRRKSGTIVTVLEGRVAVSEIHAHLPAQITPSQSGLPSSANGNRSAVVPDVRNSVSAHRPKASEPIYLSAGEQLSVRDGASASYPVAANLGHVTAWKQRQLVFESATLAEVAEEFNRYNEQQLIIEDAALYGFHISGVFSSSEPGSLLHFLRTRPGVQVTETGSDYRVAKKSSR